MKEKVLIIAMLAGVSFAAAAPSALELAAQFGTGAQAFELKGQHARQQLIATAKDDGKDVDVTRVVKYSATPARVVAISPYGMVTPLGDGAATITATIGNLKSVVKVKVQQFGVEQPINFANQIVPIFTKAGCNGGGCHGKSGRAEWFPPIVVGL